MTSCAERERVETFHQAFDEDLFRDTVTRERRRADRSGLAMAMLLVGVQDSRHENTPALFARIARALAAIRSDIDILGWFERESILGLIVPELDRANLENSAGALACRLSCTPTSSIAMANPDRSSRLRSLVTVSRKRSSSKAW